MDRVAAETVNGRYRVYSAFFNYLEAEQLLDHNPMTGIRLLRVEHRIKPVLDVDQMELLLNSFNSRTFCGTRDRLAVLVTLDACLRLGELVHLRTEDCHTTDRLVRVSGKSRYERLVPITPRTAKGIHNWLLRFRSKLPGDRLLCFRNGDGMYEDYMRLVIVRAGLRVGLRVYPHMLRRSGATAMHQNGADIEIVRRILGHRDIRTTQSYICHGIKAVSEAHDRFSVVARLDVG